MKKLFALLLVLTMVLSFTACGEKEDASTANSNQTQSQTQSAEEPSSEAQTATQGSGWDSDIYATYTKNIPEPEFEYEIFGTIGNMGMSFNTDTTVTNEQIQQWKKALLDSGFEANTEAGETWNIYNDTHSVLYAGNGYFTIQTK